MDGRPWRMTLGGVLLTVRVTARGGRDAVEGRERLADGREVLKIRVRTAPVDRAANESVRRLVAGLLARPASSVRLESGATSRLKSLAIDGDPAEIAAALEHATEAGTTP